MVYHKIRRGETLGMIAAKFGVSVNQLRDWNNISGNKIMSGKNLKIYPDGTSNTVAVNETKNTVTKIIFTNTKLKEAIALVRLQSNLVFQQIKSKME